MSQSFIGAGWAFPTAIDSQGRVARSDGGQAVHQSIWMILSTAKGERIMEPDFGCGIYDLVFSPSNESTLGQVRQEVVEALVRWEPRIDVLGVAVRTDDDALNRLLIDIQYAVRNTNSRFNLVYPFYLE